MSADFNSKNQDSGIFKYTGDGFVIHLASGITTISWMDIREIIVYKADLLATDEIRMDILTADTRITITEESPGWHQFVETLNTNLPIDPPDWESSIVHPPFATNQIVIYQQSV